MNILLFLLLVVPLVNGLDITANYTELRDATHVKGPQQFKCLLSHCGPQLAVCALKPDCKQALHCDMGCDPGDPSCFFICEVTYGVESQQYQNLVNCMVDHKCLQKFPDDGECLVQPKDGLSSVKDTAAVAGDWWVLRGLNPHYDSYQCQHNRFVKLADGNWVNNVTWLNTYHKPPLLIDAVPIVTVPSPGVLLHNYTTLGQIENWIIISKPSKDYWLALWCGENKELHYAGGIVVSPYKDKPIPRGINARFRAAAQRFGLDYDKQLFLNDNSACEEDQK